jgi:hypothetical protein
MENVVLKYMELGADSPEKEELERRFGKKHLVKLVAKYEEEKENEKWLEASTTACPGCGARVEKNLVGDCICRREQELTSEQGCNHVSCAMRNTGVKYDYL